MLRVTARLLTIVGAASLLGALTSLNDDLRHGVRGDFFLIWLAWLRTSSALAAFGVLVHLGLTRWPRLLSSARSIARGYLLTLLLALPWQLLLVLRSLLADEAAGDGAWLQRLADLDPYTGLLRWSLVTAIYAALVAWRLWRQSQAREQAALRLALELERQRALALRAQLEPHFVFNALNAISALVRSDQALALEGIERLSGLLQYALAAGERDWVDLGEELAFIEDYLALQRLRHGARLQVRIDGADEALGIDCPPLLLQPLIENALRHELETHEHPSDIRLTLEQRQEHLLILVGNALHPQATPNPGAGLGLKHIAARLRLAYGSAAALQAGPSAGRFEVAIRIPRHAD